MRCAPEEESSGAHVFFALAGGEKWERWEDWGRWEDCEDWEACRLALVEILACCRLQTAKL